ncbi:MAG: hypothetical protein Q8P28_05295 [Deltaproteobacteria bacterium]|nr:hypothetical protein [Deltaproteobacteria bacterium]
MSFKILLASIVIFVICLGLHIFIWRWWCPRNRAVALLIIFIIVPGIAGVIITGFNWFGFIADVMNVSRAGWLAVYLLHFAISAGYILSYPAVEAVSPSLALSLIIGDSEKKGLSYDDLSGYFSTKALLQPRIQELLEAELIAESNGHISITRRGIALVNCFILLRKMLGLPTGRG